MNLRAGFSRVDITPPPGLPMGGYAARIDVATGVLDPLSCRAVTLQGSGAPLVLVALDLIHVAAPWASDLRRRVAGALATEPERVLVAATHTHSGPGVFRSAPLAGEGIASYEKLVATRVVEAARLARGAAEPAELHAGAAAASGVGASRREVRDKIDDQVRVLVARRHDASRIGVLAFFGCHPTVLPPANLCYSRDLFGAAVDRAEAALGAPVVLFNGAAADVSTRFTRRSATVEEVRRLGDLLAAGITGAVDGARGFEIDEPRIAVRHVPVHLRPVDTEERSGARVAEAAAAVQRARESGVDASELRLATSRLEGALVQLWVARQGGWQALLGRTPETAELQAISLGGVRVIGVPGEVFSDAGRRLCGRDALLAGYANDYLGYLVPPERAAEGEYESLIAALAPETAAVIEKTLAEMRSHV
jgi:hypothetical protein